MAVVISFAPPPADAASRPTVGPCPNWVQPVAVSVAAGGASDSKSGATYLELFDYQENQTLARPEAYTHVAIRVLNEQGIAGASQLTVAFDPSCQALTIHDVKVHRAGQVLDRLVPSQVKVIQREQRLEYQVYDGRLTALLLLEDVRAGDVVEYRYTLAGVSPALAGECDEVVHTGLDIPVGRFEQRLLWDPARPLTIRNFGAHPVPDPRIEDLGRVRRYVWSVAPMPVVEIEDYLPYGYDPLPGFQLSSIRSWVDVVSWGVDLFSSSVALSAPLREKVAEIRSRAPNSEAAALAAIRFVQDEVRYLGIEMGVGSHRPTDPSRVLQRRFGDCKDKVLLLVTMLRSLGWQADPALVSFARGGAIETFAPSRGAFDHAIVRLERDGHVYWIDPTLQGQRAGMLSRLSLPKYGMALVLRPGVDRLARVVPSPDAQPLITIEKTYDAERHDAATPLRVESTYHGSAAEDLRRRLRNQTREELQKFYLSFYKQTYPEIEATDSISVTDDDDLNLVTIVERYSIPGFWKRLEKQSRFAAQLKPIEFSGMIPPAPSPKRTMPLAVLLPTHVVISSRVHLGTEWSPRPASSTIENEGFRLKIRSAGEGRTLLFTCDLERLREVLAPEAAAAYSSDLGRLDDETAFTALSGVDVDSDKAVNWWGAVLLMLALGGSTLGAAAVYRHRPATESVPHVESPDTAETTNAGAVPRSEEHVTPSSQALPIGGWLSLLALGLVLNPVVFLMSNASSFRILQSGFWNAAIHAEGGTNVGMASLLMLELGTAVVLLAGYVLLLVMFLKRRRLFVPLWIWVMGCTLAYTMIDLVLASWIANTTTEPKQIGILVRSIILTFAWGIYLTRSLRARKTFVL